MGRRRRRSGRSRWFLEMRALIDEIAVGQKRTDEQLQRTDEQLQRTDEQLRRTDEQLQRTDEQVQRTREEMAEIHKEIHKEIRDLRRTVGEFTGAWGRFSEDLLAPSILAAVRGLGIQIRLADRRVRAWRNDQVVKETDAVVHGLHGRPERPVCLVASIKTRARPEDVDRLVTDVDRFHDLYPIARGSELLGMLAAVGIDDHVRERAEKKGLYVIQTGPKIARIVNGRDFRPRIWRPAS